VATLTSAAPDSTRLFEFSVEDSLIQLEIDSHVFDELTVWPGRYGGPFLGPIITDG